MNLAAKIITAVCSLTFAVSAGAETLVSDTFESIKWAPLSSRGNMDIVETSPVFGHAPYVRLDNGVFYIDLGQTLTTDFTLTFSALHEKWSRTLFAGFTDATGTKGYGMRWGSGNGPTQFRGTGNVVITKYSSQPNVANPRYYGDELTEPAITHHPATVENATEFATISLSWNAVTSTITLSVNGVIKASVVDTSYKSFSRVIIGGGTGSLFDNLDVDTAALPHPVTAASF